MQNFSLSRYASKAPIACLTFFLLTLIVYFPAFQAGFIIDDSGHFLDDPLMTASDGLYRIWFDPGQGSIWNYWPVSRTILLAERNLWGSDPVGYHAFSVFLHFVNVCLLWGLLRSWRVTGAWLVALLFLLHPVQVEAVAWISQQKELLACLFYLLAIGSYLQFERLRDSQSIRHSLGFAWYGVALLCFALALLSKSTTAMLPVVLIFCRWWLKLPWQKMDILRLFPFFLLSCGSAALSIWFESVSIGGAHPLPPFERFLVAGHVPFFYLSKLVWPYPLMFHYPQWQLGVGHWVHYLPWVSLVGIAAILLYKFRSWGRPWFLSLGCFWVTLFPLLGFFKVGWFGASFVADHWLYLPGLSILLGTGVVGQRWFQASGGVKIAVCGLLLILGGLTWQQTYIYRDSVTLWEDTLQKNPTSWVAYHELGIAAEKQAQYEDALRYYTQALQHKSDSRWTYLARGKIHLSHFQNYELAIQDFSETLQLNSDDTDAYGGRGTAYLRTQQYELALNDFDQVLQRKPDSLAAYQLRAELWVALQEYEKALADLNRVLDSIPKDAQLLNNRGHVYSQLNQHEDAWNDFTTALQLNPSFVDARLNRAMFAMTRQQHEAAIDDWTHLIQQATDPEARPLISSEILVQAHIKRGLSYIQLQQYEAAFADLNAALQDDPNNVEALLNRAKLYVVLQQYLPALENLNQTLHVEPNLAEAYEIRGSLHMAVFGNKSAACQDWKQACALGSCQPWQVAVSRNDCKP